MSTLHAVGMLWDCFLWYGQLSRRSSIQGDEIFCIRDHLCLSLAQSENSFPATNSRRKDLDFPCSLFIGNSVSISRQEDQIPYRPGGWVLPPAPAPREQLCNRSCSNKTHTQECSGRQEERSGTWSATRDFGRFTTRTEDLCTVQQNAIVQCPLVCSWGCRSRS
jgi:hypothetical protein